MIWYHLLEKSQCQERNFDRTKRHDMSTMDRGQLFTQINQLI